MPFIILLLLPSCVEIFPTALEVRHSLSYYLMSSDKLRNEVLHVADSVNNYSFMHLHFSLSSLNICGSEHHVL